jgi:hypothetical protein
MLASTTGLAGTTDPVHEHINDDPPPVEESSTEVLISTQQVVFSTAAALGPRRESIGARFVAIMRQMIVTSTDESRPQRGHHPTHYRYIENARMAREMERL